MTGLKPRSRGGVIYADGYVEGKRIQRSTGLKVGTDKRRVQTVLNNIYYEEVRKMKEQRPPSGGRSSSEPTFRDAYDAYLKRFNKRVSKDSKRRAKMYLNYFQDTPLKDITKPYLSKAIQDIHYSDGKAREPQTIRRYLNVLIAILNQGERTFDVKAPRMQMPSNKSPQRLDYFEDDEVWRIIEAAEGDCIEPVIHFMLLMGARPIECFRLTWDDVRLPDPTNSVAYFKSYKGDGDLVERRTPMPSTTYHMLQRYGSTYGRSGRIVRKETGKPWKMPADSDQTGGTLTTGPRKRVYAIFEKAGARKLRPYDMRHTFATRLRAAGCELDELMELMGHEKVDTVRIYAHIKPARKQSIVEQLGRRN